MASIRYNDEFLELYKDERIKLERHGTWLEESLRDELSYNFKIPYERSAHNRQILKQLHLPQVIVQKTRLPVLVDLSGKQRPGEMVLRKYDRDLTVNLYIIGSELTVMDLKLDELNIPNSKNITQLYEDGIQESWPKAKCFFPIIKNPYFYDDPDTNAADKVNEHFEGVINQYDSANDTFVANYSSGGTTFNVNTLVPCVSLLEVLSTALAIDNYRLIGSFQKSLAWRRSWIFNNRTLDKKDNRNAKLLTGQYTNTLPVGGLQTFPLDKGEGLGADAVNDRYTVSFAASYDITFSFKVPSTGRFPGDPKLFWIRLNLPNNNFSLIQFNNDDNASGSQSNTRQVTFTSADIGFHITAELLNKSDTTATVSITDFKLEVKLSDKVLIEPKAPANLAEHLPSLKFSELLTRLMSDLNLALITDLDAKTIELIERGKFNQADYTEDFLQYLTQPLAITYKEREELIIHHEPPDDYEELRLSPYNSMIHVNRDGNVSNIKNIPANFDGRVKSLKIYPLQEEILGDPAFISLKVLSFRDKAVSDILDTGAQMISQIRLGFIFDDPTQPLGVNKVLDENLSLDNKKGSLGARLGSWFSLRMNDNRNYKAKLKLPSYKLATFDENKILIIGGVPFLIKRMNYKDGYGQDLTSVSLDLQSV